MKRKIVFHRNYKKLIGSLIILIFGILFWSVSITYQAYLSDYHGAVSVRYQESLITAQQIEDIIQGMIAREDNHIPEVTLWQRAEDVMITNEATNISVSIGLITVAGDMTKVYPDAMLYGGYLSNGDDSGCVIDRNTAYQLFGSENAVGLTIRLNNKDYTVSGILKGTGSKTMIIQEEKQVVAKNEVMKYSCMELTFSDPEDAKHLAENFINTYGLGTPTAYIDGYRYQKLSYLLIHLPVWFSAMLIILYFARRVNKLKASKVLFMSGWLGIILLSALLIRITKVSCPISSSMLPTRWSDFDFWGNQWKLLINSFGGKEGSMLYYKDILLRKRMEIVLVGVILAVLLQGVGIKVSGSENKI